MSFLLHKHFSKSIILVISSIFFLSSCYNDNKNCDKEVKALKKELQEVKEALEKVNKERKSSSYLYDLPPAPPFKKVEVVIFHIVLEEGCRMAEKSLIGYIVNYEKGTFSDYNVLIQDENGVRHKFYIETNTTSNYDLSLIPYILIPGNKIEVNYKLCGSGGFSYIQSMKSLKRQDP